MSAHKPMITGVLVALWFSALGCDITTDITTDTTTPQALPEAPYVEIIDVSSRPYNEDDILRFELLNDETALLQELYDLAVTHFPSGSWINFGPDSAYREIVFFSRGRKIRLSSWHPIFEQDPRLVASSEGITSLGGKTREEFLAQDDLEYVAQRRAFDEIEARLRQRYGS